MMNSRRRKITLTKVPAYSRTWAASFPDALIHSIPFSSCTSGPLAIPGGLLKLTYGGFIIDSGTGRRGETSPGLKRLRLPFIRSTSLFLKRKG